MKVELDQDKCVASGQCVLYAPAVFDQRDSDGIAVLLEERPGPDAWEGAREAARVCPARAIELAE
jgi:ferredoxin